MAHSGGAPTAHAGHAGPRPASMLPTPHHHDRAEKRDLASWWKNFKSRDREKKGGEQTENHGIFGVPLQESIRYANVAISLLNEEGQSYIYGYVPIVVAKCGVYLKEKATDVEGIFRLAGSEKRIKELKVAFDSPDRFGKGLDWAGYTVHDAANILRRYFNQLPEPIIPLEFYQPFRDPLRNHQEQAVGALDAQSPSVGDFDHGHAIRKFQRLITELPPLNRQLLLYILDLLAVFASKSDLNKMTTANLAAIFQPGILSHPQHDMAPQEYRLSQDVLIFLIENQDHFLIGMQGTGADDTLIRNVQSGAPTPSRGSNSPGTPTRSRTVIGRSASNASAGAESVRKWGSLRRNVSVSSSNHSKRSDGGPVPVGAPTTPTGSGVHRSNTVPSRRGGSNSTQNSPRFSNRDSPTHIAEVVAPAAAAAALAAETSKARQHESLQSTPVAATTAQFPATTTIAQPEIISPSSSEATTPLAMGGGETFSTSAKEYQTPRKDTTPLLAPPGGSGDRSEKGSSHAPSASSGRGFLDLFKQSPTSDTEGSGGQRKPNKLQKKRIPGSSLSSAQSSNHDLHDPSASSSDARSPTVGAFPNLGQSGPQSPRQTAADVSRGDASPPVLPPIANLGVSNISVNRDPSPSGAAGARAGAAGINRASSPAGSYRSTTEDTSDADFAGDDLPREEQAPQADREKKRHRWRFSRSHNPNTKVLEPSSPPPGESSLSAALTSKGELGTSRSTVGSSNPRRSFQDAHAGASPAAGAAGGNAAPVTPDPITATDPSALTPGGPTHSATMQSSSTDRSVSVTGGGAGDAGVFSDSEREKSKNPMRWIRGKISGNKDKEKEKEKDREREREKERSRNTLSSSSMSSPNASASVATPAQQQQQQLQERGGESRVVSGGSAAAAAAASGATTTATTTTGLSPPPQQQQTTTTAAVAQQGSGDRSFEAPRAAEAIPTPAATQATPAAAASSPPMSAGSTIVPTPTAASGRVSTDAAAPPQAQPPPPPSGKTVVPVPASATAAVAGSPPAASSAVAAPGAAAVLPGTAPPPINAAPVDDPRESVSSPSEGLKAGEDQARSVVAPPPAAAAAAGQGESSAGTAGTTTAA